MIIIVYLYKSLSCCQNVLSQCRKFLEKFKHCCSRCPIQQAENVDEDKQDSKDNSLIYSFLAFMILSYSKFGLASIKTLLFADLFDSTGNSVAK